MRVVYCFQSVPSLFDTIFIVFQEKNNTMNFLNSIRQEDFKLLKLNLFSVDVEIAVNI